MQRIYVHEQAISSRCVIRTLPIAPVQKKTPAKQYLPAGVFLKVLVAGLVLSLTENAVHLGATYWADALCHATTGL